MIDESKVGSAKAVAAQPEFVDMSEAPLPTPTTVRRRNSLPIQLWRFGALNLRMIDMIRKGH